MRLCSILGYVLGGLETVANFNVEVTVVPHEGPFVVRHNYTIVESNLLTKYSSCVLSSIISSSVQDTTVR